MKKFLIIFLCLFIVLTTVGCGGEKPEQAVKSMLDAVKAANQEAAEKYIDYDKLTDQEEDGSFASKNEEIYKLILKNLNYKILSSSEDGDKATVKAEITNIDMKPIMDKMFSDAIALAFSGLSDEQLEQKFNKNFEKLINNKDNKTITNTVTITLNKKDNHWKIDVSDELANAISGNLITVQKEMKDSFGGSDTSDKLDEIDSWLTEDIWNKGFCDINWYTYDGTDSSGDTIDIEFTLQQLDSSIKVKAEYDKYMGQLKGEEYNELKGIWGKLSAEIDSLSSQIKNNPPKASDESTGVDTGKFEQYSDAFSDAINKLE
ncbi:DUF5105 domain-containing protein [Aminipila terrae]|uniref:DUF5105 domain-containing protein n=1 Tax=Aminipila terrae TaxID=2697030 RepID=A0A6P1MJU5_9FIRM|nr:DUF5105 domain-containing protein [Aminipila terrae]QHI72924.1 DUF5105 domain-containing protein [Aminipila terrae]